MPPIYRIGLSTLKAIIIFCCKRLCSFYKQKCNKFCSLIIRSDISSNHSFKLMQHTQNLTKPDIEKLCIPAARTGSHGFAYCYIRVDFMFQNNIQYLSLTKLMI